MPANSLRVNRLKFLYHFCITSLDVIQFYLYFKALLEHLKLKQVIKLRLILQYATVGHKKEYMINNPSREGCGVVLTLAPRFFSIQSLEFAEKA